MGNNEINIDVLKGIKLSEIKKWVDKELASGDKFAFPVIEYNVMSEENEPCAIFFMLKKIRKPKRVWVSVKEQRVRGGNK